MSLVPSMYAKNRAAWEILLIQKNILTFISSKFFKHITSREWNRWCSLQFQAIFYHQ